MSEDIKNLAQTKKFKAAIGIVVGLAAVLVIFQAGVFVGFHKASFLFKGGDNFYRAFGERGKDMPLFRDEMSGGHGAVGKIVRVNLPNIVVLGPDEIEKVVLTSDTTEVRRFRDISSLTALAADQYIAVLGSPNDQGQIVAKFIRILPPPTSNSPPAYTSSSTNTH